MITQAELTALDWIQAHLRSGAMDTVMQVITLFGEYGVFWILLALGLLIYPRTRKLGLAMVFALLLDVVLCNGILKPLVARPRPYTWRPELEVIRQMRDYSFPSGHTAAAFAGTFALLGMRCRGWIPALALSVLLGPSTALGAGIGTMFLSLGNAFMFGGLLATLPDEARFAAFEKALRQATERKGMKR